MGLLAIAATKHHSVLHCCNLKDYPLPVATTVSLKACQWHAEEGAGRFAMPLLQGSFHQMRGLKFRAHDGSITLVARRAAQRAGVRHWRRGADPQARNPKPSGVCCAASVNRTAARH